MKYLFESFDDFINEARLRPDQIESVSNWLAHSMANHTIPDDKGKYTDEQILKAIKYVPDSKYITNKSDKQEIVNKVKEILTESELNEGRIQYKRQYTENHPARTMNSNTKVRGKILSAIGDGVITEDELNNILKELNAHPRWVRRNSHLLKITENGYTLSKEGKRMSRYITVAKTVNESLDYSEVFKILDAAAMFTSTAHEAADQVWQDKDDLIDYLLSDHIPKKYHKKFLSYVK